MPRYSFKSFSVAFQLLCCTFIFLHPSIPYALSIESDTLKQQLTKSGIYSVSETELAGIRQFYAMRQYHPVWITPKFSRALLEQALTLIAGADAEGLDSQDYQLQRLQQLQQQADQSAPSTIELEIRTTHALLRLAQDLAHGRLLAQSADPDWHIPRPEFHAPTFLQDAIETLRLKPAFESLSPQRPDYRLLKETLARYRKLADAGRNWMQIPPTESIHPGSTSHVILFVRERIAQAFTADGIAAFNLPANQSQQYDEALVAAVQAFQAQHGLNTDGVIGKNTIKALNIPLDWKIRQLRINMERHRWLPRNLGERYLLVNTAGFTLSAIESGESALTMRIIVGRDYRSTPSFNSTMSHMVLNPFWNVPATIAREDLLPKQQKDPHFFASSGFKIYPGHDRNAASIDPNTVDWHEYKKNFPFFLRQEPGAHNALGKVKFMFPNSFSIYLHDTPAKSLFKKDVRTFSSGCIRLEKPMELAAFALNRDNLLEKFNAHLQDDKTVTMHLPKPLPIYLVYITAWADVPSKMVRFYPDIYDRDFNALHYARW